MTQGPDTMALIYTTWPDAESAQSAAARLLEEGLIACANILAPARSVFRWAGEVQVETEVPALFKTAPARASQLAERIAALHPYDEPAIIRLAVERNGSSPAFLDWVIAETGPGRLGA